MNRYDMQDLIIEDEEFKEKKPKKVITLLALIIIILLVGTVIMKYAIGDEKSQESDNSIKKERNIAKRDNELAPIRDRNIEINPQKNRHNIKDSNLLQEDELSEIIPIKRNKIEEKPKIDEAKKISQTSHITDIIPDNNKVMEKQKVESKKDITISKVTTKNINSIRHNEIAKKSNRVKKSNKKIHKIHKKRVAYHKTNKPSELFKKRHTTSVTKKVNGIYYIQVGSFSKQPNKKYIENIKKYHYKYKLFKSGGLTKVRIGPYTNYEFAKSKLPTIKKDLGVAGFVVRVK